MNYWYNTPASGEGVIVSSRIRLARNAADLPFPGRMSRQQEEQLLTRTREVVGEWHAEPFTEYGTDTPAGKLAALAERHVLSPEFVDSDRLRAAFVSADASVSLMVNEEDHLRLQLLGPGLCLDELLARAERLEDALDAKLHFAFDEQLGFLTHCPTNLGCGLRAGVMLHLPALTESGRMRAVSESAAKLGLAVRGFFGEGSSAAGALYQISNRGTLGLSEAETVRRVSDAVERIAAEELRVRREAHKADPVAMADRVGRAVGLLGSAHRMSTTEAMGLLSDVRLGLSLSLSKESEEHTLLSLLGDIMPAVIDPEGTMSAPQRDARRAELLREAYRTDRG